MIVVADTSPINYLILIGEIEVLGTLYGRVLIPKAVHEELSRPGAPEPVRLWIAQPPVWLEIRSHSAAPDPSLARLDLGEREAIALAEELAADQIVLDEMLGRRAAQKRGLTVIGTVGVLRDAASEGLLDLRSSIERLQRTNFHISPAILAILFDQSR
jgi:predicted nucleic acid-binding protein